MLLLGKLELRVGIRVSPVADRSRVAASDLSAAEPTVCQCFFFVLCKPMRHSSRFNSGTGHTGPGRASDHTSRYPMRWVLCAAARARAVAWPSPTTSPTDPMPRASSDSWPTEQMPLSQQVPSPGWAEGPGGHIHRTPTRAAESRRSVAAVRAALCCAVLRLVPHYVSTASLHRQGMCGMWTPDMRQRRLSAFANLSAPRLLTAEQVSKAGRPGRSRHAVKTCGAAGARKRERAYARGRQAPTSKTASQPLAPLRARGTGSVGDSVGEGAAAAGTGGARADCAGT